MNRDEIKAASDAQLFDWMANAFVTQGCAGHHKGQQNELLAEKYRTELIERGNDVPDIDLFTGDRSYRNQLFETGTFNGAGSY